MTDSTHRAIRTAVQALFGALAGLVVVLPLVAHALPVGALVAASTAIVGVAAGVSKGWNLAQAAGLIPAWLKGANGAGQVVTDRLDSVLDDPDSHDHPTLTPVPVAPAAS